MIDQYAVIGNPIAHSKSPWIHTEFAKHAKQPIQYGLLEADSDERSFIEAITAFRDRGGKGANVTMPFKEMAWNLADTLSERAKLAGAVNTLSFSPDGQIMGDTTDGVGLVNDLIINLSVNLKGCKVLVLGAGGAVKGAVQSLLETEPELLHIANRTLPRAMDLVDTFGHLGSITASNYDDVSELGVFDVIINATPTNFNGELPAVSAQIFSAETLAYDMSYGAVPTLFESWAAEQGAYTSNGLGMLVEQAAEAFFIWRGIHPQSSQVLSDLRKVL